VTFTGATAAWSPVAGVLSGPGGFFVSGGTFDEWITNHQLGELLGFIGNPALNLNAGPPRVIAQDAPGLFVIGDTTVPVVETGRAGELWLGFNDDFASNGIGDNTGTASVTVTLSGVARVPEPASLFLLAFGLAALAGATWRRHRRK